MFNTKIKNFGLVRVLGGSVRLYESPSVYHTIAIGREISDARWAGDAILVNLTEGGSRRYTTLSQYQTIR
jgi:hypothetical protein